MDRRQEMRRTAEQLSTPDPAIRDFLMIPDDDYYADAGRKAGRAAAADGGGSAATIKWKALRDRLRLRRVMNAWTTPSAKPVSPFRRNSSGSLSSGSTGSSRSDKYIYAPGEATAAFSRTPTRPSPARPTPTFTLKRVTSTRVAPTATFSSRARAVVPDDDEDSGDDDDDEEGEEAVPAAQMSLMALLEQSDSQWDDDDDDGGGKNANGDDDEDDGEGREEEMVHVCCVCMVRHKGAAFIPCGHTFCRLCSRELWVSRGNCPLCNGFIQEILDIF